LIRRKIIKIVAARCQILRLKCTKFDFGWGSAPDPAGRAYSAPRDPLAEFCSKANRREGKEMGRDREGEGREGRERRKGKGRGIRTPLWIGLVTGLQTSYRFSKMAVIISEIYFRFQFW